LTTRREIRLVLFHYLVSKEGRLSVGDPFGIQAAEANVGEDALAALGYSLSQEVGDRGGISYVLYEHPEKGWIVRFDTVDRFCLIACPTWLDLIPLLASLSSIALAGLINHVDVLGLDCSAHLPVRVRTSRRQ
jgi:hypothetical protein